MEGSREQRRWNTGQLLRSLDESPFRRSVEPSSHGRSLVSRLGMTDVSCFPSSRSRRASNRTELLHDASKRSIPQRRNEAARAFPDRGKSLAQGGGIRIRNNELAEEVEVESSSYDSEEQLFDLSLPEDSLLDREAMRSSSGKRKSSSFARGSTSNSGGTGKAKVEEHAKILRGSNFRRPSSTLSSFIEGQRPKVSRRGVDALDAGASSSTLHASSSRVESHTSECDRLLNTSLTRRPSAGFSSFDTRSRSRNYDSSSSAETVPTLESIRSARRSGLLSSDSRDAPASSSIFRKRNIATCFGSNRRSRPIGGQRSRQAGSSLDSATQVAPSSSVSTALEAMPSSSNAYQLREEDDSDPVSPGWDYHRPRLMAEGLAKILMALERVETDEDLTQELLMLEATVLLGGMGLYDRHRAWRMDVDSMSYEELLALGERIGNVSTGLTAKTIANKLRKCRFNSSRSSYSQDDELKCSICQEEYKNGEQLGRIDCEHKYHVACIKQWLEHKNMCPICKATALS